MNDVHVIDEPAAATVALDPLRSRLLSELREPACAATLAGRVELPRQKVNYHLRTLESHGLVRVDSRKQWGGLTERRLVASASAYVVSPSALGPVAADPDRDMDRLSASYLPPRSNQSPRREVPRRIRTRWTIAPARAHGPPAAEVGTRTEEPPCQ